MKANIQSLIRQIYCSSSICLKSIPEPYGCLVHAHYRRVNKWVPNTGLC